MQRHILFALLLTTIVAGCVSAPPAPVAPPPAPKPMPVAATPPPAPIYRGDWRDWPLQPGNWVYGRDARGSIARFGVAGAPADVTLRCDRGAGQVILSRRGTAPDNPAMVIRTTSIVKTLPTQTDASAPSYLAATMRTNDTLLDAMGYSRGRFVIEQGALPVLVIPAWAEVLRVAEDCRP